MKTIDEMIEVMQAFKNGKKIEYCELFSDNWKYIKTPCWDWNNNDYRIKEEPKYRPYATTDELINDFCNRFGVTRTKFGEPFIWVKKHNDNKAFLINAYDFDYEEVEINCAIFNVRELFEKFTYLDGSPCGIKE